MDAVGLFGRAQQTGVGVHDVLSGLLVSQYPFDFAWLSSFGVSAIRGLPDMGILDASDVLRLLGPLSRAIPLPVVVDMEVGYGSPSKVHHAVFEAFGLGAAAISLEDNPISKWCSLYELPGRILVSAEEHATRIRAARLAADEVGKHSVVVARTEALVAGLGVGEALRRCDLYVKAGADAVFVQCTEPSGRQLLAFCEYWNRRTPIVVSPTRQLGLTRETLFEAGATHVIFANHLVRAAHAAMRSALEHLVAGGSAGAVDHMISSIDDVRADLGGPGGSFDPIVGDGLEAVRHRGTGA